MITKKYIIIADFVDGYEEIEFSLLLNKIKNTATKHNISIIREED